MKMNIQVPSPQERHVINEVMLRQAAFSLVSTDAGAVRITVEAFTPFFIGWPLRMAGGYRCIELPPCSPIVSNEVLFEQFRLQWRRERAATSSITNIVSCPSYQRIIAMGRGVIPLILRQIESEGDDPDHWGWALLFSQEKIRYRMMLLVIR